MKTEDIMLLGAAGVGVYLLATKGDVKKPDWMSNLPGVNLSDLFSGLNIGGGIGSGDLENLLGKLGIDADQPGIDLSKLVPGLTKPNLNLPQLPLPKLPGSGETTVEKGSEPTIPSWSDTAKGFINEHPIASAAIGIPLAGAATYGAIKMTPTITRGMAATGKGISSVASDIYNSVKLPKKFNIFKVTKKPVVKSVVRSSIGKELALGAEKYGFKSFLGDLGIAGGAVMGAASLTDLFARAFGIQHYAGQSVINFFSVIPGGASANADNTNTTGAQTIKYQLAQPAFKYEKFTKAYPVSKTYEKPFKVWGTKNNLPVVSKNNPETYPAWEWY